MANPLLDMLVQGMGPSMARQARIPINFDTSMPDNTYGYYIRPDSPTKDANTILLNPKYNKLGDLMDTLRHEQVHYILRNHQFNKNASLSRPERFVKNWMGGDPQREAPAYAFGSGKPFGNFINPKEVQDFRANFLSTAPPDVIQQLLKLFGRTVAQSE